MLDVKSDNKESCGRKRKQSNWLENYRGDVILDKKDWKYLSGELYFSTDLKEIREHGHVAKSLPGRGKSNVEGHGVEVWSGIVGRPDKLCQNEQGEEFRG